MKGLLLLLLVWGCAGPREMRSPALPDLGQVPGAQAAGPVETFARGHLWVNLNGAASIYEDYGCQQLWTRSYTVEGEQLSARLFAMDLPLHAFGLFGQLRPAGSRALVLGDGAALGKSELIFWQGRHFVSLLLRDPGASAPALLERVGQVLSRQLPPGQGAPQILALLPAEGRVAHSEQYLRENALGHASLGNGVGAAYHLEGGGAMLYVFALASEVAAQAGLAEVAAGLEDRRGFDLGVGGVQGRDPYEGDTVLFAQGTHLVLLRGGPEGEERHRLLKRCVAKLAGEG